MDEYHVQANQFLSEKYVEDRERNLSVDHPVDQFQQNTENEQPKRSWLKVARQLVAAILPGGSSA